MQKEDIARTVKAKRLEKGYTQNKLAELSKLSLRSIQRIEKAEVYPREYTIKVLTEVLEIEEVPANKERIENKPSLSKKIILSGGSFLLILFLSLAFISQAPTFPENHFEAYIYWSFVVILISGSQWFIWNNSGNR
jgi:transcriptional regulator with XRE-family HTH domain